MLSVGATSPAGFEALAGHWDVVGEQAQLAGLAADRSRWRLAGPMHLAETAEQARRDVEYGLLDWARYFQQVGAVPQVQIVGDSTAELIEAVNSEGAGVIGTPADAVAQIRRLTEQSGGFGCYLLIGHDWAGPEQTARSYELFARFVMPEFQGAMDAVRRTRAHSAERFAELSAAQSAAIANAKGSYESTRGASA